MTDSGTIFPKNSKTKRTDCTNGTFHNGLKNCLRFFSIPKPVGFYLLTLKIQKYKITLFQFLISAKLQSILTSSVCTKNK